LLSSPHKWGPSTFVKTGFPLQPALAEAGAGMTRFLKLRHLLRFGRVDDWCLACYSMVLCKGHTCSTGSARTGEGHH